MDAIPGLDELGGGTEPGVLHRVRLVLEADIDGTQVVPDRGPVHRAEKGTDVAVIASRRDSAVTCPAGGEADKQRAARRHQLPVLRKREWLADLVVDPDDREPAAQVPLLRRQGGVA